MWFWRPGATPAGGVAPLAGAAGWSQISASSQSGALPAGRYWHATGVLADQLYVYGGRTAAGGAGDMWAFNIPAARWAPVTISGAQPGALSYPAGQMIGRHFYIYSGDGVTPTFWRFVPTGGAPPPAAETFIFSSQGTAAGLAISILLNIATLSLTVLMWRRAGSPSFKATTQAMGPTYEVLDAA